jgi:hypothetical protein
MPVSIRLHLAIVSSFASLALLVACGDTEDGSGSGGAGGHGGAGDPTTTSASSASGASTSPGASGSGSGSASASGGASGSSSGGGGAVDCKSLPLCDDFEGATAGGPPGGKWSVVNPNCSGTSTVAVDGAMAHSGTKSVKVTGKGGYCNHVFFSNQDALAAIGKVVFGRFFLRLSDPLGDGHTTFMAMKDTADAGGKDLRMGGQSKILMWNRESDDATMPALSPVGISKSVAPATNQWHCVEFMVDGDKGFMQTWVDDAEVLGLHVDSMPTPDVDQQWLNKAWKPSLVDWKLGWESYAGQDMTLWFDDVALAAQRIGCK